MSQGVSEFESRSICPSRSAKLHGKHFSLRWHCKLKAFHMSKRAHVSEPRRFIKCKRGRDWKLNKCKNRVPYCIYVTVWNENLEPWFVLNCGSSGELLYTDASVKGKSQGFAAVRLSGKQTNHLVQNRVCVRCVDSWTKLCMHCTGPGRVPQQYLSWEMMEKRHFV